MRVALVDPSLFTWPYDSALALALASAGHTVRIFGKPLAAEGAGPAHALLEPHFYRRVPSTVEARRHPLFAARKGLAHVWSMGTLLSELRVFRPDVIHFQWTPLPAVDQLFVASLRRIAPLVLTVHDSSPFNGNPRSRVQRLGALSIMTRFDRVIVHTEQAAERVHGYGVPRARTFRVPHGLLEEHALPLRPPRAHDAPVRVLLFGRIKPYKGADVLIRAAAAMDPSIRRRCRIDIIGQPFMDLAPLARLVRDAALHEQVSIEPRFVADEEIGVLLASADVIALPYREIDASGVLMTSLAARAPIVATRIGLFSELLIDGEHGRLIDVDDHVALARALEQLIADPLLRTRMGESVGRLRDAIPSWSTIAALTARVYATCAASVEETRALEI